MKKKSNLWLFWSCKLLKNCSEWSPWSVSFQGWQHPHPYETGVTEWFAESQNVSQIIWELESPDFNSCNAFPFYFEGVTQMTIPVIVVWIILVKITQSMVVVKFWFEIYLFIFFTAQRCYTTLKPLLLINNMLQPHMLIIQPTVTPGGDLYVICIFSKIILQICDWMLKRLIFEGDISTL